MKMIAGAILILAASILLTGAMASNDPEADLLILAAIPVALFGSVVFYRDWHEHSPS